MDGFIIVGVVWVIFLVGLWIALGTVLTSESVDLPKESKISGAENNPEGLTESMILGIEKKQSWSDVRPIKSIDD